MARNAVRLGHLSLEVASIASARRYHDRFLGTLGFRVFQEGTWYLGYRTPGMVVWFFRRGRRAQVRREWPPVPLADEEVIPEHVGFAARTWQAVADWEDRLRARGLPPLYPVDRGPARTASERYRSAAWVDRDRIVWEIYALRPRPVRRKKGARGGAVRVRVRRRSASDGFARARHRP